MIITLHTWTTADKPALMALCNAVDRTFLSDRLPYPYTEADAGVVIQDQDFTTLGSHRCVKKLYEDSIFPFSCPSWPWQTFIFIL